MLRRCRAWAAEVGEVRIGDDPANPVIAVQLSAVDTESILADAGRHDNAGRRRLVREILFDELGIEDRDKLVLYHEATWRGTKRRFEVIFANVRELPDESLSTRGDERKVVVDFPFDEPGHTPNDDRARLDNFRGREARARTLVWLPSFLSAPVQRDLGALVRIDHVLAGERLRDFAAHLSPVDQASARDGAARRLARSRAGGAGVVAMAGRGGPGARIRNAGAGRGGHPRDRRGRRNPNAGTGAPPAAPGDDRRPVRRSGTRAAARGGNVDRPPLRDGPVRGAAQTGGAGRRCPTSASGSSWPRSTPAAASSPAAPWPRASASHSSGSAASSPPCAGC